MKASFSSSRNFKPVNISLLTVSDTRNEITDKSGLYLANSINETGHNLVEKKIVKDELDHVMADTINNFPQSIQPYLDMIEGQRMDLTKTRYETATQNSMCMDVCRNHYVRWGSAFGG